MALAVASTVARSFVESRTRMTKRLPVCAPGSALCAPVGFQDLDVGEPASAPRASGATLAVNHCSVTARLSFMPAKATCSRAMPSWRAAWPTNRLVSQLRSRMRAAV